MGGDAVGRCLAAVRGTADCAAGCAMGGRREPAVLSTAATWMTVSIVLLLGATGHAQQPEQPPNAPVALADLIGTAPLSADDAARLARHVGERLHQVKRVTPLPPALGADAAPRIVFVSVSDGEQTAHVVMSPARGAVGAADGAVARVAKLLPEVAQRAWIKVDVVSAVQPLGQAATNLALGINPSLEGLELAGGAAFLPEELCGWGLVAGGRLIEDALYDYLDARPHRASLTADAQLRGVRRFTCASFFIEDDNTPLPLYRGHRAFATATPEALRAAADAAGAYLVRSVQDSGRVDYSYRLDLDEFPRDYNIVRHAGAVWGLLDLYRETKDEEQLAAIERALRYLLAQIHPLRIGEQQGVGLVWDDEVSLGGNALAALALGTYIEVTGKRDHLPILRVLGKSLRAAQAPGGRFAIQRQRFSSGEVFFEDGPYAPGEAVLALLKVNDVDPDPALLDAAARGAKFLITVRDAGRMPQELPHDHWLLYALRHLHARRPDKLYVEHAVRLSRAIIDQQHEPGDQVPPDAIGAWAEARSTPAAVRSEGLLAAAALMDRVGLKGEATEFRSAAAAAIAFQLRTQVWPESAMHCRNPRRAIGAFREDLGGVYVRIDFIQHNLSGILELMRQTGQLKPK